jgi:hypothetical protein
VASDAHSVVAEHLEDSAAPRGVIAFADLPLQLAWATLNRVERSGPGSKVPRDQLASIFESVTSKLCPDDDNDSPLATHGEIEPCAADSTLAGV